MSEYPEHDKLAKVKDHSQAIGLFLDGPCGFVRATWTTETMCECVDGRVETIYGDLEKCGICNGTGTRKLATPRLVPDHRTIERVLADYYEIDLCVIEQEKRAMLEKLRESAA